MWIGRDRQRGLLLWVALLAALASVQPGAAAQPAGDPKEKGKWGEVIEDWPNVPIHVHVLPNGKVLFWGRREWENGKPKQGAEGRLDPQTCVPRLWDPQTNQFKALSKLDVNLFCSGHAFLPDGRLFVAGGHIADNNGLPLAIIYNPETEQWEKQSPMNDGRWYPTVVSLPNGGILVSGGTRLNRPNNPIQQVWQNGTWRNIQRHDDIPFSPKLHVAPDGRVFLSGSLLLAQLLSTGSNSRWERVAESANPQREEGCSVMYDVGKVLIVGGGKPPVRTAQRIDLTQPGGGWTSAGQMKHKRRHHNATLLPDGTVLVTGGTRGNAFNDVKEAVKEPELWDPASPEEWTTMAPESVPRLYHSTAVLLPDARVLSAGGGEYRPDEQENRDPHSPDKANLPEHTHRNAQIFEPPYLFRGERPVIADAPPVLRYGTAFTVKTPQAGTIGHVSLVRLSSVTHSWNMNQRINFLDFAPGRGELTVTPPPGPNACPPGHYMLFLLNQEKVPSVATIVRIDRN